MRVFSRRPLASAVVMLWLAAGCTLDPEIPQGLPDPVAAGEGICGLLAVEEIEVALNRPVSGTAQPSGVRPVLSGMRMCALGTQEDGVAWGVLSSDAVEDGSTEDVFRRYVRWHDRYLQPLSVEGREAFWDEQLRTLVVLADGHMVGMRVGVPEPDAEDDDAEDENDATTDEDPALTARNQAVDLVARVLSRLS